MTNALRPLLTVAASTPTSSTYMQHGRINTVLFVSLRLSFFILRVFVSVLVGACARGASANAASLKTIVRCTEGDDYMLCERQNEPSRPPELVQLFYWRLQSMGSGTRKLGRGGGGSNCYHPLKIFFA